jgi:hypothetical protein
MSEPKRIQRKRTKGWRMPEGAVYVGRPSRWGNPWAIETFMGGWSVDVLRGAGRANHLGVFETERAARQAAVDRFRSEMLWDFSRFADLREDYLWQLRGRDLACWCPLDQPCHADVLLEMANR